MIPKNNFVAIFELIKFIDELKKEDLNGKRVLLRVDFNVNVGKDGKIEEFKIRANKEAIDYLLENGASVVMLSHIDPPLDSFSKIVDQISKILGRDFSFISLSDFLARNYKLETNNCFLVDNIRQDPREVQNDEVFAQALSKAIPNDSSESFGRLTPEGFRGFDLYVDDAFASMHRNHASVSAVAKLLPAYAGLLIRKEVVHLQQVLDAPREGKILVMGGAKISTKLPVIKNFLDKADKILIGGAIANNFFKAFGINVGASVVDSSVKPEPGLEKQVVLPEDMIVTNDKTGNGSLISCDSIRGVEKDELIVDVGRNTAAQFAEIIKKSEMVIWNGPLGLSEVHDFAEGTEVVANAVVAVKNSIIGGGDTIAAVTRLGLLEKYGFVSSGGGAMLDFLAGKKLPGLEALDYYK